MNRKAKQVSDATEGTADSPWEQSAARAKAKALFDHKGAPQPQPQAVEWGFAVEPLHRRLTDRSLFWKDVLGLNKWEISVQLYRLSEFKDSRPAMIQVDLFSQSATVMVLHPDDTSRGTRTIDSELAMLQGLVLVRIAAVGISLAGTAPWAFTEVSRDIAIALFKALPVFNGLYDEILKRLDQKDVQLAGCSTAASGCGNVAKREDYGWSVAYQDTLDLRAKCEAGLKRQARLEASLKKLKPKRKR